MKAEPKVSKKSAAEISVLSLGAGVQSSALALMYAAREIEPMPVAAVFADTKGEPKGVYDWLAQLERKLPFPIRTVSRGDLREDFLAVLRGEKKRCAQPPLYVREPATTNRGGMLWRQCTREYKLEPIIKECAKLKKEHGANRVIQIIGISLDEAHRRKGAMTSWSENSYPLVDRRISRWDCVRWLKSHGFPEPPKSACFFCPYINNERWKRMKRDLPVEFQRAIEFDEELRKYSTKQIGSAGITGEMFLHRSFKPLREAVLTDEEIGQSEFALECEGMCGV